MSGSDGGEQTTTQEPWGAQQPYLRDLFNRAQGQVEQGGQIAGFGPDQRAAQQQVRQMAQQAPGQQQIGQAQDTLGRALTGDMGPELDAQLQAAIRPAQQQFTEQAMPQIQRDSLAQGQLGGSRQGVAEGIATRGFMDQVTDASTRIQDRQAQRAMQAAGMMPQVTGAGQQQRLQQLAALEQQGAQQQALEQAMADQPMRDLQLYQQLIGGNFGGETTQPGPQTSTGQLALGGAATGAGIGSNFGPAGAAWGTGIGAGAGVLSSFF